jgi:tetratricopeptide (TPR) repeat protein
MKTIREEAREKFAAVEAMFADREYAFRAISPLAGGEIAVELQRDERLHSLGGLNAVLDRATDELRRDLNVASRLIDAVLERAPALPISDARLILRGRALRLQAWVLRERGAVREARVLLAEAYAVLATTSAGAVEREYARLLDAYILSETGQVDEALAIVREAVEHFALLSDAKGQLQALLTEAAIHFEQDDFKAARSIYERTLPLAESVRDVRGRALSLGNLGICAARLGEITRALTYFAQALPLYAELGMSTNRQQILWEMAKLAVGQDRLADACYQFASVREDFLRRGMFLSAAFVALDFTEVLIAIGRRGTARQWCEELVRTFSSAGLPGFVLSALRRLEETAKKGQLDEQVLGNVRADIREHLQACA